MDEVIEVARVTEATPELAQRLAALQAQLGPSVAPVDQTHLGLLVQAESTRLLVARIGDEIVGMLTLLLAPVPSGWHAYIEDVVVDEPYRGRGVAAKLVDAALDTAARTGAEKVELTSNPLREAANRLYERLGFERRETNVYRYRIDEA